MDKSVQRSIFAQKLRNSNTILNMLSTRQGPKDKLQRHPEHHEPKGAPKFAAPYTNFGFITCWVHLVAPLGMEIVADKIVADKQNDAKGLPLILT